MTVYRILVSLLAPVMLLVLLWRRAIGRETSASLSQRCGFSAAPRSGDGPILWVHGASNGELASARRLIATALERVPALHIVVTANTVTGCAMAAGWGLDRLTAQAAPLDHRLALSRFLGHWRPAGLITLEADIWPNRFALCAARGIPVLMVGARMSAKSARNWGLVPRLARAVLASIGWLSAQDAGSEARFSALGLPPDRLGPVIDLKAASLEGSLAALATALANALANTDPHRATTFLAASTHDGEDAIVLEGFAAARQKRPDLRLILAPRHPQRAPAIRALLDASGLSYAVRSDGQVPGPDTAVYLADTMGEMAEWYRLAGMTFVGGSLVDIGGHNPFEPASAGSAILHGPHVGNFKSSYQALAAGLAAIELRDARALRVALLEVADEATQRAMATAAVPVLLDGIGPQATEAVFAALAKATGLPALAPDTPEA